MKKFGIVCPRCDEFVWSRNRHDFRYCSCGYCAADGGSDYTKISYGGEEFEKPWKPPTTESREVTLTEEDEQLMSYVPRF